MEGLKGVAVLMGAAIVAVVGLGPLGGANASEGPQVVATISDPLTEPTLELSAQAMAFDYRLDINEARRQILLQEQTQVIANRAAEELGDAFAGAYIDHADHGTLVVRSTSPAQPVESMRLATQGGVTVRMDASQYSWEYLKSLANVLDQQLRANGVDLVHVTPDPYIGRVRVVTPAEGARAATAFSKAQSLIRAEPAALVEAKGRVPRVAGPDSCTTTVFYVCDPPLRGGVEIQANTNLHAGQVTTCTAGVNVRSTTGTPRINYLLTAGHCLKTQPSSCANGGSGTNSWSTAFGSDLTVHQVGGAGTDSYVYDGYPCGVPDRAHDAGKITVSNPSGWGLPTSSKVLVLASSGPDRSTTFAPQYAITSLGTAASLTAWSSYLCWTGATSGTSCRKFVGTTSNSYIIQTSQKVNAACGGDSGGPVYSSGKLYGLVESIEPGSTKTITRYLWPGTSDTVECTALNGVMYAISAVVSFADLSVELVP